MEDEPDVIKMLDGKEEIEVDMAKTKNQNIEPQKYTHIEPDYGANLRKAFAFVIVIILISAAVLFYISATFKESDQILKAEQEKFIGIWEAKNNYYDYQNHQITTWTFYENKTMQVTNYYYPIYDVYYSAPDITFETDKLNRTLKVTGINYGENYYISPYSEFGTYKIGNRKLCVKLGYQSEFTCYDYEFSKNDLQLTLNSSQHYLSMTLNKISDSSSVSSSPNILSWNNINITVYGPSNVHYDWINLTRSNISYSYTQAFSEWKNVSVGDIIQIGKYDSEVHIKLTWIPTNSTLGVWHFGNYSQENRLVAYWDFDEGSGNILYDKSGNDNYGEILGATFISGKSGYALEFNGVSDYIDLGSTSFLSGTTEFTVSLWINISDYPTGWGEYRMFELGTYYGSSPNTILLYIRYDTNDSIFLVNNDFPVTGGVVPLNKWVHIVVTFKGGSSTKIYVDGVLKDTNTSFIPNYLNNGILPTKIGGSEFGSRYYFKGAIDDVRIYNYALSADEIANLQ